MFLEDAPHFCAARPRGPHGRHRHRGGVGRVPEGGGGWGRMFGGEPQRADRGAVRYLVLDAIADEARHGYEIMQVVETRSRGAYRPSPGVVYPTLQLLDELGHVRVSERDGKKVYAITAEGTADLDAHREEVTAFYDRCEDSTPDPGDLRDVMRRVQRLLHALRRAARRGRLTPTALSQLGTALDTAAAKLESLLDE